MTKASPNAPKQTKAKPPENEADLQKTPVLSQENAKKADFSESSASPLPLPSRDAGEPGSERVSVKIVDGKLDRESFRAKSADAIRAALKNSLQDPEFRAWAGLPDAAVNPQAVEELFQDEQFGAMLDVIAKFEIIFMAGRTGLSSKEIGPMLEWTAGEHMILDKQGARLMRKYVPVEWLQRLDLWIFIITFASLILAKMKRVTEYAEEKLERMARNNQPAQPQTPNASEQKAA